MAVARNIVVGFIARTEAFTKAVRSVRKDLSGFGKSVARTNAAVSRMSKLALGALGFAGLSAVLKSAVANMDKFAKLSGTAAAGKLKRAVAAIDKMKESFNLVIQSGLARFAPMLELIAKRLSRMIDILKQVDYSAVSFGLKIAAIIYFAPKIVAAVITVIKAIQGVAAAMAVAQGAAGPAGWASLTIGAAAAAVAVATINYAFDEIEQSVHNASLDMVAMGSGAAQVEDAAKGIADAMETAADATARMAEPVDELEKLRRQVYEFGKTERQLSELQLQRDTGRGRADGHPIWGEFDSLWDRIEAQQQWAKSVEEATSVFEETRTPLEQYEARISRLNDLLNSGALDWDTYGRAVRMAREKLEGGGRPYNPGEFEVVRRDLVSLTGPDSQRNLQLEEAKKQTRLLETIAHKEGLM